MKADELESLINSQHCSNTWRQARIRRLRT